MITDKEGDVFLKIVGVKNQTNSVQLFVCHKTFGSDNFSNYQAGIECDNNAIGDKIFDKSFLVKKAKKLENGYTTKQIVDLGAGLVVGVYSGKMFVRGSGCLGGSEGFGAYKTKLFLTVASLTGTATYFTSKVLTSLLFDLKLQHSLENISESEEVIVVLKQNIEDFISDISDAVLE